MKREQNGALCEIREKNRKQYLEAEVFIDLEVHRFIIALERVPVNFPIRMT
jgi:hypothetical protein